MIHFDIEKGNTISNLFLQLGIPDFDAACAYIANLPYKRNSNKTNLMLVLEERGGTCSTKHAILRKLCLEQGHPEVLLKMGIFKMDAKYSPKIHQTLATHQLTYIPEAHNYLQYQNEYRDYTRVGANYTDFSDALLDEITIEYHQIEDFKIMYHQSYLSHWIQQEQLPYRLAEIWQIREQCIQDLQS